MSSDQFGKNIRVETINGDRNFSEVDITHVVSEFEMKVCIEYYNLKKLVPERKVVKTRNIKIL